MTELEMKEAVENEAEEFTDELSDEALDRTLGSDLVFYCTCPTVSNCSIIVPANS